MDLKEVQEEIQRMRDDDLSYGDIAKHYDVNKGLIYRILNDGYEPKDKEIRRRMGFEDIKVNYIRQVRSPKGTFVRDE